MERFHGVRSLTVYGRRRGACNAVGSRSEKERKREREREGRVVERVSSLESRGSENGFVPESLG